jgi:hypothetical protein
MKPDSGTPPGVPPAGQPLWWRILRRPSTRLGWWSFGLAVTFVILMVINGAVFMQLPETEWGPIILPFYGVLMILCGLAAGITGLIAAARQHERSWVAWFGLLPGLFVLLLLLGEFLVPH